jgi:predicted ATPase/class 3 adenylate cyclase
MTGMRRERKVVTVVFVDLVGFTARSEAMDPEDVEMELDRYHARVRHELERHGGTVEKFIGDAVMAVFGAPVAHEDDPERAVRAALAVRDWATTEANLEMRVGVYTGETLVRLDARAEAGEGLAVGDVVNTASRLQSAAPTNGIVVGEATYRATSAQIEYREAEPVIAKGKSEPIPIWEAVSARSQFGVDVEQAPRTVFVGRDNEVGLLRGALARARDQREPQLVTLVGVPGMGKSRLVYELSRIVDDDPDLVTWRQGRCLSYGDGVSMWALAEIVKAQAGIFETDEPATADEKLAKTVDALEFDGDRAWLSEQLRPLIGLGGADASRSSRDEQFAAWQQFLEALAETSPAVLIFEDLHWADDLLLDFLDEFADRASGVPLLIVCTARLELLTKRPNWGAGRTNALTLSLPPLSEDHTRTLVRELVTSAIADDLQHAVLERADGNPLYAEEFARMLAERPTQDIVIPDTVQGILAARLDALAPQDKRLLQAAAVIGKVFWAGALEAGTGLARADIDVSLRELERREMVRRDRRSSVAGDIEYAFRHILVRDVAYGQLPRADRSEFHRKTAEWIAALGRPEDYAELIAHHYVSALDYARAANRDVTSFVDATRTALRNAGERAAGLRAHSSAVEFFRRALDLAVSEPDRGELLVAYGNAQWAHAGAGLDSLAEGAEELARLGRAEDAADAIIFISRSEAASGALDASERWLDAADRLLAGLAGAPLRYK